MKNLRAFRSSEALSGICLAALLALIPSALADDWPQWRGPNRDGISKESGWLANWPAEGPKKLWEASVGVGYSSFSVSKGKLYTMGNVAENDIVSCFDAGTGKLEWKHEYPCLSKDPNGYHGTRCTPTVDGGLVYTLSRQGNFFCLDAATGKVKWSKDFRKDFGSESPRWGFAGSPLIEKDWVLAEVGGEVRDAGGLREPEEPLVRLVVVAEGVHPVGRDREVEALEALPRRGERFRVPLRLEMDLAPRERHGVHAERRSMEEDRDSRAARDWRGRPAWRARPP